MSKHTVKVDNRSLGKLQGGFTAGYDADKKLKFLPFGSLSVNESFELILSVLHDLMHVPLKYGATKEMVYDEVVLNFSLMIDQYLPEKKLEDLDTSRQILEEAKEITRKKLADAKNPQGTS